MADEATPEETPEETPETVPADRFREVAKHKKAAEERAKTAEREAAELRAQMEDREQAGLPELDKLRKQLEQATQRAQEAETRAQEHERAVSNLRKEGWVTAVARELNFHDPEDALNPRYVNLDEVETREDAERVLKKVARSKKHLIKPDEPERPEIGRVLRNGREETPGTVPAGQGGQIDLNDPATKRALGEEMLGVLTGGQGR